MKSVRPVRPVSLAILPLFLRLMVRFSIVLEFALFLFLLNRVPLPHLIFGMIVFFPQMLGTAFVISAVLTIFCYFAVIFIVRPRMLKWRQPRVDDSSSAFHLEPRETVDVDLPARMQVGRRWHSGRLVRTNRRILFLPAAWDTEPWMIARDQADTGEVVPSPNLFWNTVRNIPPRLQITPNDEPLRSFVVPDPYAWLPPQIELSQSFTSPLPLEQRVS